MLSYPAPRFESLPPPSSSHERICRVRLESPSGLACDVCNYGAAIHRLWVPDARGHLTNVVLGYETLNEYLADTYFMGATVGRVANRLENGQFSLAGQHYQLECNNPPHHLHGGPNGWNKLTWSSASLDTNQGCGVVFSLRSPAGDEGYPGTVLATVSYLLSESDLHIVMSATTDALTLINMAHHSYFNLKGSGDILGHELEILADDYTPGAPMVPRGEIRSVEGTPLDFRSRKLVGTELPQVDGCPDGYDHNYLLRPASSSSELTPAFSERTSSGVEDALCHGVKLAARLSDPSTGRRMDLFTNQPGLQLYTGNYLDGRAGVPTTLQRHAGLCLETQAVPNFANIPDFAHQGILAPETSYRHEMRLSFSAS